MYILEAHVGHAIRPFMGTIAVWSFTEAIHQVWFVLMLPMEAVQCVVADTVTCAGSLREAEAGRLFFYFFYFYAVISAGLFLIPPFFITPAIN